MNASIESHYGGGKDLAIRIRHDLAAAGKDLERLTTADLATVDEFHIRGRQATLELAEALAVTSESLVLDIGSGLGGPARTLAETYGCRVTGVDLTRAFCDAANAISAWLGMADKVHCLQADATDLPFEPETFDAAITIHAAMNIRDKDTLYAEARRVLKPGARFAVYDVLQGEGGPVHFPVPWARDASISHLATPEQMGSLLAGAGFEILEESNSTEASTAWFREMAARLEGGNPPAVTFRSFLGNDFNEMARNVLRNLDEKRIRTVTYLCRA